MKYLLLVMCALLTAGGALALDLVRDGQPAAVIVLGADASEPEKNAAAELADYIEKISGARLETAQEPSRDMANILVGQTEVTKEALPGFDWASLKRDGVVLQAVPGGLALAGDRPRGTLYAVYEFLERYLGVRYLAPDAEIVPKSGTVSVPDRMKYVYTPPMFSREVFYKPNQEDFKLAVKLKLNGHSNSIPEEWGDNCELIGFAHTFGHMLLPESKYFADHPEWYSEINGQRLPYQPCLSNPEVLDKLAENVLAELDKRKDPQMISITQNDNSSPCQCEKCQAMVKEFGAESGMLINALNYISDKIKDRYPDVMLETFAYQYTVPAPTNIVPRDNVIVRICDIENNFGEPIRDRSKNRPYKLMENSRLFPYVDHQTVNGDFYKSLEDWSRIAKHLFIWNYTVNFFNYYIIHPNFHSLKPDVETFARHKVSAVFEQGDCFNRAVAFNVVKQYLMAHLLWDPSVDDDALMREFMRDYYGDAWQDLYDLICYCEKIIRDKHIFLSTYMNDVSWMSADELTECFRLFTSALSKVSGRQEYRDRVYNELLFFQTGWYLADEETRKKVAASGYLQITDPEKFRKTLYEHAVATHNDRYYEGNNIAVTYLADMPVLKRSGNTPDICKDLKEEDWFELTAADLEGDGVISKTVEDGSASAGTALAIAAPGGDPSECMGKEAARKRIPKELLAKYKQGYRKMRVYAVARTEGKASGDGELPAFDYLLTDNGVRMGKTVPLGELSGEWQTVELTESVLWFPFAACVFVDAMAAPCDVYIDRLIFVFEKPDKR